MEIYEKIFARLEELNMSQTELSRRTGIATSTISDWRKKKINPQADKLVPIYRALDMSLVDLLCDEKDVERRLIRYYEMIEICREINANNESKKNKRNVSVIQDIDGNNIVVINDIIFRAKPIIDWDSVEQYLLRYVGDFYTIATNSELVYIGTDLPDEYAHSEYTRILKGANAKAKANAVQGIPEMIEIALETKHIPNKKKKHNKDAKYGWYKYESRFALPVYGNDGEISRYNVYHVAMLLRHSQDGKKYLYDIMNIKKETSNLFQS